MTESFEKTATIKDAATAAGYRTPTQFVKVWEAAGLPILRPSPRKRSVFIADLHRFLTEHTTKPKADDFNI
jgi:hypothetical protein